jgi:AcrR family transcriptional regulator
VIEMQRCRLLLAMQELAAQNGLESVTVGQVCKRSRVSRRTFYDLFGDRDACFLAAFEQAIELIGERILPAYHQQEPWRARIRAGLDKLLVLFDEQPQLASVCVVETLKGGPAVLQRRRDLLDLLAAAVDEGRAEARDGTGPPALTAESTVGGVLAVIHARLLESEPGSLTQLGPSLAGMIVFPYLGSAASRRETQRTTRVENASAPHASASGSKYAGSDPFRDLSLRFTYRTALVLATIAAHPGASNRQIGDTAGVSDQGQISKLLKRLQRAGLVENDGAGRESGEPNAWRLTSRGRAVDSALGAARVGA